MRTLAMPDDRVDGEGVRFRHTAESYTSTCKHHMRSPEMQLLAVAGCWGASADARMPCCCRVVLEAHAKYCAGLKQIWDVYKDRFAMQRTGTMRIT